MNTTQMTRLAHSHGLLAACCAMITLTVSCGQGESARAPTPDDEYEIIHRREEQALEDGPKPLNQAMAEYASTPRDDLAAVAPQPSEDQSALTGWAFKAGAAATAGEATMPAECAGAANPMACWGEKLRNSKGCVACHSIDGVTQQPCPTWKGLFGKERPLVGGETVIADESYITNSILNSWDQIVQGYGKTMPPYHLTSKEVEALVAYIKSLGEGG